MSGSRVYHGPAVSVEIRDADCGCRCITELGQKDRRENIVGKDFAETSLVGQAYLAILQSPYNSWRIGQQRLLCELRDHIAKVTGETDQTIQEHYERLAIKYNVVEATTPPGRFPGGEEGPH